MSGIQLGYCSLLPQNEARGFPLGKISNRGAPFVTQKEKAIPSVDIFRRREHLSSSKRPFKKGRSAIKTKKDKKGYILQYKII